MISLESYVPVLKWRMGEYMSLSRLSSSTKECITPLIVVPPIEYDFEKEKDSKTIDEHLDGIGKKLSDKWGRRHAMIELHDSISKKKMKSGDLSEAFLYDDLLQHKCTFSPVVRMGCSKKILRAIVNVLPDLTSVALRLSLPDIVDVDSNKKIKNILTALGVNYGDVELIIDLGRPDSFSPYEEFAKLLSHYFNEIENLEQFRSFSLIGTSLDLRVVKKPGGEYLRNCLLYTSPSPRDRQKSRMPSSA